MTVTCETLPFQWRMAKRLYLGNDFLGGNEALLNRLPIMACFVSKVE